MSLILRSKCQDLLDNFGLGHLHTTVSNYKKLSIVSECGKPFMTIQGIQFSREIPSVAEIEIAVELLDNFLGLHGADILAFIVAAKKFNVKKEPTSKKFNCNYYENRDYHTDIKNSSSNCNYKDNLVQVRMSIKKSTTIDLVSPINSIKDLDKLAKFKINEKNMKDCKIFLKKFHAYKDEENDVEKLKEKLSVCDV